MRECINCKHSMGMGSDVWCEHKPEGKQLICQVKILIVLIMNQTNINMLK